MSSEAAVARAAALLAAGEVVAFPTETVYGLGARADDPRAVRRIYLAKGRPPSVPLIVHLTGKPAALPLAAVWSAAANKLADAFWPGSVTLVVQRADSVIDEVTAGRDTVALRVPSHPVARQLLEACDFPVVAPSANSFGERPPRTAAEVMAGLGGRIPLILDGGAVGRAASERPAPSTIVDVTSEPPVVLRDGAVSRAELGAVVTVA
ncbi:MAG: threonylcarbamoyl-AMP synthase [Deltaproteobacteria bacterium]|nr:threonylcarbamoyl-AMP synthase [Deltaproteobacteria bacterium]MBW2531316.1 threonylcarbamoyl-AMP synthase [Deltaproteobacteria bacterium]